jgi:SAM-dependent methyltransferase
MSDYFNDKKRAKEYIYMTEGYDGREVVDMLAEFLKPGSKVLELGMGPGRDIPILEEKFNVTGSDFSTAFLELYKKDNPGADLLHLDAITLDTHRTFDCIYSNKVLHQITREELKKSFIRQARVLNPGGILCHTLWYGDKEIEVKGMRFVYYTEMTILNYLPDGFDVLYDRCYMEMDNNDSMLFIARKR